MATREENRAATMRRHKQALCSFIEREGHGPALVYGSCSTPEELAAFNAVVYIRRNGSPPERSYMERMLRLRGTSAREAAADAAPDDFSDGLRRLANWIYRNGRKPSVEGANHIERRLANFMYRFSKNGTPEQREAVRGVLGRYGEDIREVRSFEEMFASLASFMRREGHFPKAKGWLKEIGEARREEDRLYQFGSRIVRSGNLERISRLSDLVVRYDVDNTCTLFISEEDLAQFVTRGRPRSDGADGAGDIGDEFVRAPAGEDASAATGPDDGLGALLGNPANRPSGCGASLPVPGSRPAGGPEPAGPVFRYRMVSIVDFSGDGGPVCPPPDDGLAFDVREGVPGAAPGFRVRAGGTWHSVGPEGLFCVWTGRGVSVMPPKLFSVLYDAVPGSFSCRPRLRSRAREAGRDVGLGV